jgi:hypothetical protein
MDHNEERPPLGNGYRLDLVRVSGRVVLCREDGTEVARFSLREATAQVVEQVAREDRRTNQQGYPEPYAEAL